MLCTMQTVHDSSYFLAVLQSTGLHTAELSVAQLGGIAQQDEVLVAVGLEGEGEGDVVNDGVRLHSHKAASAVRITVTLLQMSHCGFSISTFPGENVSKKALCEETLKCDRYVSLILQRQNMRSPAELRMAERLQNTVRECACLHEEDPLGALGWGVLHELAQHTHLVPCTLLVAQKARHVVRFHA